MARIRTIKPDFFRHEGLFEAEHETGMPLRVAFAGLWTAADREGRFKWLPRQLKLDCLPFDDVDFARVLDALLTRGHIVKYEVDGKTYGAIPSWHQHQAINNREAASDLPAPPDDAASEMDTATAPASAQEHEIATDLTRAARVDDASTTALVHAPGEGKGKEGKEIGDASLTLDAPTRTDAPTQHSAPAKKKQNQKTPMPADFTVSERVTTWAHTKGFDRLDQHLESFKTKVAANGYRYVDWDAALINAIRDDWAGIRSGRGGQSAAGTNPWEGAR